MQHTYYYIRTPDGKEFEFHECLLIAKFNEISVKEQELKTVNWEHATFFGDIVVDETFLGS